MLGKEDLFEIEIRAFQAIKDEKSCSIFVEGHAKVLDDINITKLSTNDDKWTQNENIYVIVAEKNGKMLGGIRIHISEEGTLLPLEQGVGKQDPKVYEMVKKEREHGGTAELCGLWNSKEYSYRLGLALLLVLTALAIANQLPITTMLTMVAKHTLPIAQKTGFVINDTLGDHGKFIYPSERFISRILGLINTVTLETAAPEYKKIMLNLREQPCQTNIIQLRNTPLKVHYNLQLPE